MGSNQFGPKKLPYHELDKQLAVIQTELANKAEALKSALTQVDRLDSQLNKIREDYETQVTKVTRDYHKSERQMVEMKAELKLVKSEARKNKLKSIFLGIAASLLIFLSTVVGSIGVNLITQKPSDTNGWWFIFLAGGIFFSATVYTALK